jgi:hypothetical protein
LRHLSLAYLEGALADSRKEMRDSWTTIGLNQGIKNLVKQANDLAIHVTTESNNIRKLANHIYDLFRTKHGFEITSPPELNLNRFLTRMQELEAMTQEFCSDPINLFTEKRFLIRKFFLSVGAEAQKAYQDAQKDTELWIDRVINTLKQQIEVHKEALDQRIKGLMEARSGSESLRNQILSVQKDYNNVAAQCKLLDDTLLQMMKAILQSSKIKEEHLEKERKLKEMHFEGF